jgi:hypothetical protein
MHRGRKIGKSRTQKHWILLDICTETGFHGVLCSWCIFSLLVYYILTVCWYNVNPSPADVSPKMCSWRLLDEENPGRYVHDSTHVPWMKCPMDDTYYGSFILASCCKNVPPFTPDILYRCSESTRKC